MFHATVTSVFGFDFAADIATMCCHFNNFIREEKQWTKRVQMSGDIGMHRKKKKCRNVNINSVENASHGLVSVHAFKRPVYVWPRVRGRIYSSAHARTVLCSQL